MSSNAWEKILIENNFKSWARDPNKFNAETRKYLSRKLVSKKQELLKNYVKYQPIVVEKGCKIDINEEKILTPQVYLHDEVSTTSYSAHLIEVL